MPGKSVDVIISPQGDVKVEAQGYSGSSCTEATKFITEALGKQVSEEKTADYYKQGQTHVTQGHGGGGGNYSGM